MSEYIPTSETDEDDDDDNKESSPKQQSRGRQLGELLFGRDKGPEDESESTPEERRPLWGDNSEEAPEGRSFLARLMGRETSDKTPTEEVPAEEVPTEEVHEVELSRDIPEPIEIPEVQISHEVEETPEEVASLTTEEERLVLQDKVAAHEQVVEPTPEDMAVDRLYEKIDEKLADPDKEPAEVITEAYQETIVEEGLDQLSASAPDNEPEAVSEPESEPDTGPEEDKDEDLTITSTASSSSSTPPAPVAPTPTPGTPPPNPPLPPVGPPAPFPSPYGPPPMPIPGGPASGYNAAPLTPSPTPEDLRDAERRGQTRGLVVGGIVGYLLGRRRGRIKTERRLMPVQEKLQKKVEELQETVDAHEQQIRHLAAEKARLANAGREAIVAQKTSAPELVKPQPVTVPVSPLAQPNASVQPNIVSPNIEAPLPVLVPYQPVERQSPHLATAEVPHPEAQSFHVEAMSHAELLRAGEQVSIDGVPLSTIFETKQVTEQGMRHILTEYYQGGDVARALMEERAIKQLAYERDPHIRDGLTAAQDDVERSTPGSTATGAAAIGTETGTPLEPVATNDTLFAQSKLVSPLSADVPDDKAADRAARVRQLAIAGWVTFVVILAVVAVILIVSR